MKRNTAAKSPDKKLLLCVPIALVGLMDQALRQPEFNQYNRINRSKFIRAAIREKLARAGISMTSEAE